MRKALFFYSLVLLGFTSFSQVGSIKGTVKDGETQEGIFGATVLLQGTTQGSVADINGDFEILKIKSGTYNVVISFVSYESDTLKNITVYPDQTTVLNVPLFEETKRLADVVVSGERITNSDVSVITEIKKMDVVLVGISAQQISLSQDRDAAQVIRRVPGVTIVNNKFVNVRGLNERYNTVLLNGVIAPSTEVDSRAFAFDLVPSGMIDRMLVMKSGTADMPGEFGGAVINIYTKSVAEEDGISVDMSAGFRSNTTFQNFSQDTKSKTDWLGFDNNVRPLPSTFPQDNIADYSQSPETRPIIEAATKSLTNNWGTSVSKAAPDLRTTLNFSKKVKFGNVKFSNVSSLSYTNTRQSITQNNYYYDIYKPENKESDPRYHYIDTRDAVTARVGLISNFILELNPKNRFEFRNLFNQQGVSTITERTGQEIVQGQDVYNRALNYSSRQIYSGQVAGKHNINDHFSADWVLGYASTNSDQPDFRRVRSQKNTSEVGANFSTVIPPTASTFDAGRFFSELSETGITEAVNFEYKVNPDAASERIFTISAGYYGGQTKRDFNARWFAYKISSLNTSYSQEIFQVPFDQIFVPENIGFQSSPNNPPYFILDEGTNQTDAYKASNDLNAGYIKFLIPIAERFKLSTGLRVEDNKQQIHSFDDKGNPIDVVNPITKMLPSANLSYSITQKQIARFAYSKTLNRPIFRELAPFNFYDFDRNANIYGRPTLTTADIQNFDLRYEIYPSAAEMITVGVFYKSFKKPIETLLDGGSNIIYTYINGKSAYNYGAEIEMRKSLLGLTNSPIVDRLNLVMNASFIKSEVQIGNDNPVTVNQEKKRALQGQSPYVINGGLNYLDFDHSLQINLSYNIFGKRIFAVGDADLNTTQYEMPRNLLDLTVSKDINEHWRFKLGVQDILNQRYRLTQDSDRNKKINSIDEPIISYRPGRYVNIGFTYTL